MSDDIANSGLTARKPVVLCILDGFGLGDGGKFDATAQANTPAWDSIKAGYPGSTLITSGLDVGLPEGQMGNSEVGHMNIGAGRVVMQYLPRIDQAVAEDTIKDLPNYKDFIAKVKQSGGAVHLMGLVSDGGVHAHIDHIIALAKTLNKDGVPVKMHAFTDGRDTPPQSGKAFIETLNDAITPLSNVTFSTVSGRFYAMDRDNRWDRIEKSYEALMNAKGEYIDVAPAAVENSYDREETDEFVLPTVLDGYEGMKDGDAIMFANFRSDRAREILLAFLDKDFDGFKRSKTVDFAAAIGLVDYSDDLKTMMSTLFPPEKHSNILGEVLAASGKTQLRVAETEKYPHVTFFFNNGREVPFEGEERILVPSPKVATYDMQPEMSAPEVTQKLCDAIRTDKFDVVIINFANPDMVGHTGDLDAVIKAIEAVDNGLGQLKDVVLEKGGALIVTADHGNAEKMWDETTDGPHTAHTTNPVPVYIVSDDKALNVKSGRLADLAPTVLKLAGVPQPEEMTGEPLV